MTGAPQEQKHIEDLVVRHFDGNLTSDQEMELAEALNTSAASRQIFLSHMRMEGRLHSLGRDGFLREPGGTSQENESQPVPDRGISADRTPAESKSSVAVRRMISDPWRTWRFRVWTASTSLVAVCVVVMLIWNLWPSSVSASSVLQKTQQVAAEMVDRTYQLVMTHPEAERGPIVRKLIITVRGGGRFVVQPNRGAYVMGCDGTDYWVVPENGPVCVTGDFRALAPELKKRIPNRGLLDGILASPDEPLLLDISGLLQLIELRYDITLVDSGDSAEHHVRATRRSGIRGGASVINLQADAKSGVVLRAELSFANSRKRTFELIETPTLTAQWYHHASHAPDRSVERLDEAN